MFEELLGDRIQEIHAFAWKNRDLLCIEYGSVYLDSGLNVGSISKGIKATLESPCIAYRSKPSIDGDLKIVPPPTAVGKKTIKRCVLVQTAMGLRPPSGGFQVNRFIGKQLQEGGTHIKVFGFCYRNETRGEKIDGLPVTAYRFSDDGCDWCAVVVEDYLKLADTRSLCRWMNGEVENDKLTQLWRFYEEEISEFSPDVFVCNDVPSLRMAIRLESLQKIYICHSAEELPFGPFGGVFNCDTSERQREIVRSASRIWVLSEAMREYVGRHGGLEATKIGVPREVVFRGYCGRSDHSEAPHVLLINPGPLKGFHILVKLAVAMPEVTFTVVRSWNMTAYCSAVLESLPNVQMHPPTDDLDAYYRQAKLFLMPSLWFENLGICALEAMLRGIPVVASNVGGIREVKSGSPAVLAVTPLTGERETDAELVERYGEYKIPEQNVDEWVKVIRQLLDCEDLYRRACDDNYEAAMAYLNSSRTSYRDLLGQTLETVETSPERR